MIPKNVQNEFEYIEKQREALFQELSNYSHETLNKIPADGGWSPIQILHHLIKAENGSLMYIQKKLSFNPKLEKTSLLTDLRYVGFKLITGLPFKIKAPAVIADNLPQDAALEATKVMWDKSRQELWQWLETADDSIWDKLIFKHPFMGRVSIFHTLGFFKEHTKRHTKQIRRALPVS